MRISTRPCVNGYDQEIEGWKKGGGYHFAFMYLGTLALLHLRITVAVHLYLCILPYLCKYRKTNALWTRQWPETSFQPLSGPNWLKARKNF